MFFNAYATTITLLLRKRAEKLFKLYQAGKRRKITSKHDKFYIRDAFKVALAGLYLGGAYDEHGRLIRISLTTKTTTANQG